LPESQFREGDPSRLGVGDGTRPSEITIIPSALEDAEQFLASHEDDLTAERVQRVARLIEGFETPYGMELLATVHWASTEEPSSSSFEEVLQRVHGWNKRKRQIMTPAHIKLAHDRLVVEGWCKPLGGELNRLNRAAN
jgi:hypothetical protein